MMHFHQLTDKERATIQAALRLWQRYTGWLRRQHAAPAPDLQRVASEYGEPLVSCDVDRLIDEMDYRVPVADIYECVHCGARDTHGGPAVWFERTELDDNGATSVANCTQCGGRAILSFGLYGVTKL